MRVLVDGREFVEGRRTGIRRYVENLLLPFRGREEWAFTLVTGEPGAVPAGLAGGNVRVEGLSRRAPTVWVDQVEIPGKAARSGVEVLYSAYYKVALAGRFRRVITVYDLLFVGPGHGRVSVRMAARVQLALSVRRADRVVVTSEHTGRELVRRFPGVGGMVRLVYRDLGEGWGGGVSADDVARMRQQYGGEGAYVLYVGNFKPHKHVDRLVRAFRAVSARGEAGGRRLVVAGSDPVREGWLRGLASVNGGVHVVGAVGERDLRALYAGADWFVTASECEGFGYPVVEAMAHGTPVICHRGTALGEVAGDGAVWMADVTEEGIEGGLREAFRMGTAGRRDKSERALRQAGRFGPGRAAASWESVVREIG